MHCASIVPGVHLTQREIGSDCRLLLWPRSLLQSWSQWFPSSENFDSQTSQAEVDHTNPGHSSDLIYSRWTNRVWILPCSTMRKMAHFACQVFLKEIGVCAPCVLSVTYSRSGTLSVLCFTHTVMIVSMTSGILHATRYLVKIFLTVSEVALSFIKHVLYDNYNVSLHSSFLVVVFHSKVALALQWLQNTE